MEKLTLPGKKQLVIELFEKNGGRHQSFVIGNRTLVKARGVDELQGK